MEEANLGSSLPDISDSDSWQSQQESSTDHPHLNGQQEAVVWGETEVRINKTHRTEQPSPLPQEGLQTPEEAESQWEAMVYTMTCPSAPLSFATVQWDMPDPSAETPSPVTANSLADELDSCRLVSSLDSILLSLHQSEDTDGEVSSPEHAERRDELELSQEVNSNESSGNVSQPCDEVDLEWTTQEEEDPAQQQLLNGNIEIPQRTDSEEEQVQSVTEDAADPSESSHDPGQILSPEPGAEQESTVDLGPEAEQEKLDSTLGESGSPTTNDVECQEDDEEEGEGDEDEDDEEEGEGDEDEDEEQAASVSSNEECQEEQTMDTSCLSDTDTLEEPLQNDNVGLTIKPDQLDQLEQSGQPETSGPENDIELPEQLHTEPTNQTEETQICEVDQKVHPEELEATQQPEDSEEPHIQETQNADEPAEDEPSQNTAVQSERSEQEGCFEEQSDPTEHSEQTTVSNEMEPPVLPQHSELKQEETKQSEQSEPPEQAESLNQTQHFEDPNQSRQPQHLEPSPQTGEPEQPKQPEVADQPVQSGQCDRVECVETSEQPEPIGATVQPQQMEESEQNEQSLHTTSPSPKASTHSGQPEEPNQTDQSSITDQNYPETEVSEWTAETELTQADRLTDQSHQTEQPECTKDTSLQTVVANGEQPKPSGTAEPHMNGGGVDREKARRLAERLYRLDGIQPIDVVKHLDKDNDFSRAVGEEYLKFFDFTGQSLDHALRSFLKVVVLIGETQERERVLQHFACRFHQCNPDSLPSSGAVLTLTCAVMLLNTDLHGQNVGKAMTTSNFVSNLEGMNEGENFSKDLLKSFFNSIKSEPLEWAVDEKELFLEENDKVDVQLRSKSNPFQDVPHNKNAIVFKQGFLQRKAHADIDGKRTPWGRRSWKTFYGVLKGMVLYLQKDDYRKEHQGAEEVVSVHHSLAEQAAEYTKKPHVFRLQTADWRVFLFQASSKAEMSSWISRINLVSALHSAPPFPAAVGSQRRFSRPILPAAQSAQTLERQLQSHAGMLESFQKDLAYLQENLPERRRAKELEEHRLREQYLLHEKCRFEVYIQVLEAWRNLDKTADAMDAALNLFDRTMFDSLEELGQEEAMDGLKKSHSSPSLELEMAPPPVVRVRRNISERRTYRRTFIPRRSKDL